MHFLVEHFRHKLYISALESRDCPSLQGTPKWKLALALVAAIILVFSATVHLQQYCNKVLYTIYVYMKRKRKFVNYKAWIGHLNNCVFFFFLKDASRQCLRWSSATCWLKYPLQILTSRSWLTVRKTQTDTRQTDSSIVAKTKHLINEGGQSDIIWICMFVLF